MIFQKTNFLNRFSPQKMISIFLLGFFFPVCFTVITTGLLIHQEHETWPGGPDWHCSELTMWPFQTNKQKKEGESEQVKCSILKHGQTTQHRAVREGENLTALRRMTHDSFSMGCFQLLSARVVRRCAYVGLSLCGVACGQPFGVRFCTIRFHSSISCIRKYKKQKYIYIKPEPVFNHWIFCLWKFPVVYCLRCESFTESLKKFKILYMQSPWCFAMKIMSS